VLPARALAECRDPRWATKLPCCASVSPRCTRAALRRGCHLYGNLEADKEKTREREGAAAKIGKKRLTGGRRSRRERKGRRANLNLLARGRVRAFLPRQGSGGGGGGGGGSTPGRGRVLFLKAAYTRRPGRRGKRLSLLSKRGATCGDNSIVHFIRSAALRYKHAYPLSCG